ncbi:MAG: DUF4070 domain-containing protein [Patescibacteria group bacterium]
MIVFLLRRIRFYFDFKKNRKASERRILLVYPKYPDTFWSFKHALWFIGKKAAHIPLGLLTVAAMIPKKWSIKLIDMNVSKLKDKHIRWADYVFISAMSVQADSARDVIARCKKLNVRTVAGGPLFTSTPEKFEGVADHLILNEAEVTFPRFLNDLQKEKAKKLYKAGEKEWADMKKSPVPLWHLVNLKKYASTCIQYSRGCPYDCEFCDITVLCGRVPRTKTKEQIIDELNRIYRLGWKGSVFFVDDNFIGNKKKLKEEILPAIEEWMKEKKYPFAFFTQASIELADHEDLMEGMIKAGFDIVFVGIETPNEQSLIECNKFQNKDRDLLESVKKIQKAGLQVQGGFIVGFDNDPPTIFDTQIKFIQESGVVTAMVGLLNALPRTRLYKRLKKENRLLEDTTGDNTDSTINFKPKMDPAVLVEGYHKIVRFIYEPKNYYARVRNFLRTYNPKQTKVFHFRPDRFEALIKSVFRLGIIGKERFQYWKLFFWILFNRPKFFPLAITFSIYGYHFRKVFEQSLR